MFYIKIADLTVCIKNKYNYIFDMCHDYITDNRTSDIDVEVSDSDIEAEQLEGHYPADYLETLAVYRKIAEELPKFNAVLMHGAVIDVDNTGYAFLARSGTGKTTHTMLWHKLLKDRMTIINGDKPIVRIIDGTVYAYGTPWAGKERLQTNSKTELKNICIIKRSETNSTAPVSESEALSEMLSAVYMDKSLGAYEIISHILITCNFYEIKCNMDISAAMVAYEEMNK